MDENCEIDMKVCAPAVVEKGEQRKEPYKPGHVPVLPQTAHKGGQPLIVPAHPNHNERQSMGEERVHERV